MPAWILICPQCQAENQVPRAAVSVRCGVVSYRCTCANCRAQFSGEQEYWRWLDLEAGPPGEPGVAGGLPAQAP